MSFFIFLLFLFYFNYSDKIGFGVILVTVSGAAWRMTAPSSSRCLGINPSELGRFGRRTGCGGRSLQSFLYPEFHNRPPPPTYQASMQEYRLRLVFSKMKILTNIIGF